MLGKKLQNSDTNYTIYSVINWITQDANVSLSNDEGLGISCHPGGDWNLGNTNPSVKDLPKITPPLLGGSSPG